MVHVPHYVQFDEDHLGAARLLEVLAAMYGFPKALVDCTLTRGQRQYQDITRSVVSGNPEARRLIQQMETAYDNSQATQEPEERVSLPPDMEEFLRDIGRRLENGHGEQDD